MHKAEGQGVDTLSSFSFYACIKLGIIVIYIVINIVIYMTCSICNCGCSRVLVPIDTFLHRNIKIRRFASHNLRLRSMRVLRLKTFGLPFSICMTFFFCLRLRGCGALMTCLLSLSVNELEDCEVRLSLLSDTVKSLFGLVVI